MLYLTSVRTAVLIGTLLVTPLALTQHDQTDHSAHAQHSAGQQTQIMDHSLHATDQSGHAGMTSAQPTETGQDAFAAIQEIVAILSADPKTDWSQVNIDALRDHLVDMHLVTLYAKVQSETLDNGMRYQVTGQGDTVGAIKRMVTAHALQVSNDAKWQVQTTERADGVVLVVTSSVPAHVAKIRGLGFSGFMVQGNHHKPHHLMMAKGSFGHDH